MLPSRDDTPVALELQAVDTLSPARIVAKIVEIWPLPSASSSSLEMLDEAIARLGDLRDLAPALCEQLLQVIRHGGIGRPSELAESFGRACGDPTPYVPELMALLRSGFPEEAVVALAEIANRCGEALHDHSTEISDFASRWLNNFVDDQDACLYAYNLKLSVAACQLLAECGGAAEKSRLHDLANNGYNTDLRKEAAAALERIATREDEATGLASQAAAGSGVNTGAAQAGAVVNAVRQPWLGAAGAAESQRDEAEQEVKMRLALQMDEEQIHERESADLAEAIFRSNLDAAAIDGSTGQSNEVESKLCIGNTDTQDVPKQTESVAMSSSSGVAPTSSMSSQSSSVTEVVPGQASLLKVTPHMVDKKTPSIGTVVHDNGCTACRSMARGSGCKFGATCEFCHGIHEPAEATRLGGRRRQRNVKRTQAPTWCRPATPDPFEEP